MAYRPSGHIPSRYVRMDCQCHCGVFLSRRLLAAYGGDVISSEPPSNLVEGHLGFSAPFPPVSLDSCHTFPEPSKAGLSTVSSSSVPLPFEACVSPMNGTPAVSSSPSRPISPPDKKLPKVPIFDPTLTKAPEEARAAVPEAKVCGKVEGDQLEHASFRPEICGNRGMPIKVVWEHKEEDITDGFGLCSPTRWYPCDRGHYAKCEQRTFALQMHALGLSFLKEHVADPKDLCLSILSGKLQCSPFSGDRIQSLRLSWAEALGARRQENLQDIPAGQPFCLRALSRSAELVGDPDWRILTEGVDNFCTGVPVVGIDERIPHVPQLYAPKTKWRKLDESDQDFDRSNYRSADISSDELLDKFRAEEKLGRMFPTTLGALRQEYPPERIRVASMGAIIKPDGSVRPIHDGTHGVGVNNEIRLENQLAVPGPAEMAFAVRHSGALQEIPLAVSADVSSAHRLYKHRRSDWPLMACRASSDADTVWVNCVGTFGISISSFWWSRLFGVIGRTVARWLLQHAFFQFAYVDDVHVDFYGHRKYLNFLLWLLFHELIGTPFAYHKFKRYARRLHRL